MRRGLAHTIHRRGMFKIASSAAIIAQHKPFSHLSPSSNPTGNKKFAIDLLKRSNLRGKNWQRQEDPCNLPGLKCAGRLDADSTGLMLWTDDAALAQFIIRPDTSVEKEYLVRVSGHDQWSQQQLDDTLDLLRDGQLHLDGEPLRRAGVKRLNESQLKFTLREGRHRQIRRMCSLVGLQVDAIKRVRIGGLRLASLANGCWTSLSPAQAATMFVKPADPQRAGGGSGSRPRSRAPRPGAGPDGDRFPPRPRPDNP